MTPTPASKRPLALTLLCLYLLASCLWAGVIEWSRLRHYDALPFPTPGMSPQFRTVLGLLLNVLYLATACGMLLGRRRARTACIALLVLNLAWVLVLSAGQPLILFAINVGGLAIVAVWATWVLRLPAVDVWFGIAPAVPVPTPD